MAHAVLLFFYKNGIITLLLSLEYLMKKLSLNLSILLIGFSFVAVMPAYAQITEDEGTGQTRQQSGPVTLSDPLKLTGGPQQLIGRIINAALGIVGSLALLMFVWGGLLWMTSAGSEEKVKQGREILIWATAGLALVFFSYVLVRFVIGSLTGTDLPSANQDNITGTTDERGVPVE